MPVKLNSFLNGLPKRFFILLIALLVFDISFSQGTTEVVDTSASSGLTSFLFVLSIILFVFFLLIFASTVITVRRLAKYVKKGKKLTEEQRRDLNESLNPFALFQSSSFAGFVVFVVVTFILKTLIDGAFTIGVQTAYQPTQPIAFSHKLHAGQYEIDCQYCHTGVRKSRSANIPSPNICMNCHTRVKTESEEIQKIYEAIDYNPETGKYGDNTKPIEWVRIHNLPDFAYFNHSQHVKVGGVECQTCHGSIEEMDEVYQYSNLTMGWCIDCHKKTDVNTKGNDYYTRLVEFHSGKKGGVEKLNFKVEDIGGFECSKCHY